MRFVTEGSIRLCLWLIAAATQLGRAESVSVDNPDKTNIISIKRMQPRRVSFPCLVPPQPLNGQWKLYRRFCDSGQDCDIPQGIELRNGSQLVYACDAGYRLDGSTDVFCTARGRWSTVPSCVPYNMTLHSTSRCLVWGRAVSRRDDYTYTPGIGSHKLHTRALVWNDARQTCQEEGGYLAIINSNAEANAVSDLFADSEPIVGSPHPDFAIIGFHDLYFEGDHTTVHDQSLAGAGFDHWLDGQPDNAGGNENCGSLHISGRLNDIDCDTKFGFICERPVY